MQQCVPFFVPIYFRNVQKLTLAKTEGFLHFDLGDYGEERAHLPPSAFQLSKDF